jgi:hypothetical protein
MIYIDKVSHPYFRILAELISFHHKEPNEISNDYSKDGLWILNYVSYKSGNHNKIRKNPYVAVHTEQLNSKSSKEYLDWLANAYQVWQWGNEVLPNDIKSTPFVFGYSDFYRLQMEAAKDIDVLFYGSLNNKRLDIIGDLSRKYKLTIVRDQYGPDIMKYVMRSKIILSIHYYNDPLEDFPRISPLLSVKAFVICQSSVDKNYNAIPELVVRDAENINETVGHFLANPLERLRYQDLGYDYIRRNVTSF